MLALNYSLDPGGATIKTSQHLATWNQEPRTMWWYQAAVCRRSGTNTLTPMATMLATRKHHVGEINSLVFLPVSSLPQRITVFCHTIYTNLMCAGIELELTFSDRCALQEWTKHWHTQLTCQPVGKLLRGLSAETYVYFMPLCSFTAKMTPMSIF